MARIIDIEFNDRKYTIEYNRKSVVAFTTMPKNESDAIDVAIKLIRCGLMKHHEKDTPSDDEILGWIMAMGEDAKAFVEALQDAVKDVIETIKADKEQSGFKWGVRTN